jgi:hypothetical protein
VKLSVGDRVRIALAPLHVVVGGVLIYRFATDARSPMVLVLGVAWAAFGIYKLALIRRGLRK